MQCDGNNHAGRDDQDEGHPYGDAEPPRSGKRKSTQRRAGPVDVPEVIVGQEQPDGDSCPRRQRPKPPAKFSQEPKIDPGIASDEVRKNDVLANIAEQVMAGVKGSTDHAKAKQGKSDVNGVRIFEIGKVKLANLPHSCEQIAYDDRGGGGQQMEYVNDA